MSTLSRYARNEHPTLTEKYTTRISEEDAKQFDNWCKKFGMTPSEAIRLLIIEELGVLKRQMSSFRNELSTNAGKKSAKKNKRGQTSSSSNSRST